jgi:hypothetical protein
LRRNVRRHDGCYNGDLAHARWTAWVLRSKTSFRPGQATSRPSSVGYQLIRDTALFQPQNIRWVFDGAKLRQADLAIAKKLMIDRFEAIIHSDDYLRAQWGGDRAKIRELLDKVVDVF